MKLDKNIQKFLKLKLKYNYKIRKNIHFYRKLTYKGKLKTDNGPTKLNANPAPTVPSSINQGIVLLC